jgi:4-amino-4-deoxy-L-arabinose transferase-like glycosyltransferase
VACALGISALYLTNLTRMGMYSTDEPRYADIGRAMARTGDWITPRLWGQPWFEKPALLYWMTASGFKLGLGNDLAPRLPVALLSVAFLAFFWWRLRQIFDGDVAAFSTGILATTAGWIAYSHVAVTDLPMSAFFTAAVLFALPSKNGDPPRRVAAAIALALAVLAKSGPPLVLFLPVLAMDRQNWRRWFLSWPIAAFLAVALPWHVLAAIRNGTDFLYTLFIQQQLGRFLNGERQHGQPFWFYAPILLLLLFPWFPLLLVIPRDIKTDKRARVLAVIVLFGFAFFSAAYNKLPGYILPLLPATCVLLGLGLVRPEARRKWLIAPIALLGVLPLAWFVTPEMLTSHLSMAQVPWPTAIGALAASTAVGFAVGFGLRCRVFLIAVLLTVVSFFQAEVALFPALDNVASARTLWTEKRPQCAPVLNRGLLYSLYYYSGRMLPACVIVDNASGTGQ